jgi:hypothetical protein
VTPAPEWLSDLQARFGAMLRTPLDRSSGTLRAVPSRYDEALCEDVSGSPALSPAERLAVYNRQYWCRLLGVLQSEYPLTARLVGLWFFNEHAARFLLARAPRTADIQEAADGFDAFLGETLAQPEVQAGPVRVPRRALLEAAAVDAAWRRAHAAPCEPHFRPSAGDARHLGSCRLRPRSGWTVLEESWPLMELRRDLANRPGEGAVVLPPRLPSPKVWLVFRAPGGAAQLALAPRQAQLFRLLCEHTVADALARLESAASPRERARLPGQVQAWLAQSVELGFWSGMVGPPAGKAAAGEGEV